jgi:hypothetical protein
MGQDHTPRFRGEKRGAEQRQKCAGDDVQQQDSRPIGMWSLLVHGRKTAEKPVTCKDARCTQDSKE